MWKVFRNVMAVISMAVLASCGGGGGGDDGFVGGGPGEIGSFSVGLNTLSSGGSTSLVVQLRDNQGNPLIADIPVSFTSQCRSLGLAEIESPVTATDGFARTTYTATGCSGEDRVTASATVDGVNLTETVTINVLPGTAGSIQFVSADPQVIALQGVGGVGLQQTSTVTFRVVDSGGSPLSGQQVTFSLNTSAGGLTLTTDSAVSDLQGLVQTIVQAGTVHTPVRVTATIVGTGISTQSDLIAVTSGLPDNDSVSISARVLNPAAWECDGVRVPITVRLADRFNNPVPNGTAVALTTEGGSIIGDCRTGFLGDGTEGVTGECSVDWVSQNPRPADGRVTILATAIGEESFLDNNGDGRFDASDVLFDLPEAFRDDNENGVRDAGLEPFVDFDTDGVYDGPDGCFNGPLAVSQPATCGLPAGSVGQSVNVRDDIVVVMSGTNPIVSFDPNLVTLSAGTRSQLNDDATELESCVVTNEDRDELTVTFTDQNGQTLPAGTTIEFETSVGELSGLTTFVVPNTTVTPNQYTISIVTETKVGDSFEPEEVPQTTRGDVSATITFPESQGDVEYCGAAAVVVSVPIIETVQQCTFSPS